MAILIGHSSINELGKAIGGKHGDQTKKECCFRTWYSPSGQWDYVLRPRNKTLAEKSAKAVEVACNNDNIGYGQDTRNTLYQRAKVVNFDLSKITVPCSCDCSTLMHVAAICGGANLSYGSNGLTTRTMVKAFENSGDYEVLFDKKYLTSDKYLKRGDVLVNEGVHTVIALENRVNTIENNTQVTQIKNKVDSAKSFSKSYAKTYTTTSNLNLRSGATAKKTKITVIKKGAKIRCYGYYTKTNGTDWLLVTYGNYTGFCSKKYLI